MLLLACMFLFKNILEAQSNLIKNSSFENVSYPLDCNGGAFEIAGSPTFHHVVDNWYTFQSPDYFNSMCNVTSYYNVPYNLLGTTYAKTGNAFAGIYIYIKNSPNDIKEYIYQNLATSLQQDSIYCLSYYTTRSDRTPYAVKSLGAYFSVNIPITTSTGYINATPQIVNTIDFITDTVNWVEIKGCFTAQGGEQYITIGNFNSNANTDTLSIPSTNPLTGTGTDVAYYYIDSVSLWQNSFPVGIKEQSKNEGLSVYPNPAKDVLTFKFSDAIEKNKLKIKITDVLGREILLSEFKEQLNISHLEKGIYFVTIQQGSKILGTKKIVKQ